MLRLSLAIAALVSLSGCATYNVANVTVFASTGKTLGDHVASIITGADCNLVKHIQTGKYICEQSPVYNQYPL